MRLTLRTILAYLDDVLEPVQAREIGEKIAESKEAAALMSRIKEVMRRRRIGSPELAGPGSGPDPNMVSDYLENLLSPGEVVELERLCQSSDMHLAEVAACHKILSLVVGQPIDVSDEMRERMYALGSAKAAVESVHSDGQPVMAEGMTGVETDTSSGLPEYLTRRSFGQRYGALTLVGVVTLIWTTLILSDKSLWMQPEVVQSTATDAAIEPVGNAPAPGQMNANAAAVQQNKNGPGKPAAEAVTVNNIVPPSPVPLMSPLSGNPMIPTLANSAPAMISEAPKPQTPMPENPIPAAVAVIPAESEFSYQSGDEFVIKKLAAKPEWMMYPIESGIQVEDEVASPAPFRNTYGIVNVLDVSLEPGTRIRRLPRTAETALGLELNRGQLILSRPPAAEEPVSIGFQTAGREWTITLLEPATQCAVEMIPPRPTGPPPETGDLPPAGGIAVVSGRIRISSGEQPAIELGEAEGLARWPTEGTELVLNADLGVPDWARPDGPQATPASRLLARSFEQEFLNDRPIAQSIGPAAKDRQAGISSLAVQTLALIDQYPFLVTALQSDHQVSRLEAIAGLREWLGQNPENEALLREELGRSFRTEYVSPLVRLLWGFNASDARDPKVSRQLLDWMKDDQITIRELAFEFVSKTVGKSYDYLPMAPSSERRAAMHRWEDFLKRSNGTLLPAEAPSDM